MEEKREKIHQYLRWLGAKYKVLDNITARMPNKKINLWIEPFCGSGIVYVNLKHFGLIEKGVLNDIGTWVILAHKMIRDDLDYYISEGQKYKQVIDVINKAKDKEKFKEIYMRVRKVFNDNIGTKSKEQIMRFIFLSKMGFNGLIRFNKKGQSSTAQGYLGLNYNVDEENLKKFSESLQSAKFSNTNFDDFIGKIKDRLSDQDMIFYDPPYLPTDFDESKKEKDFGNYFASKFNWYSIEKIKEYFDYFTSKGVSQMLTINDMPILKDLFKDYNITENEVFKMVKGKAGLSGKTGELIITNY